MRKGVKRMLLAAGAGAAVMGAALGLLIAMPGSAQPRPVVEEPREEARLQAQLLRHVSAIAGERNYLKREKLEAAAQYIETELGAMGYRIERQEVPSKSGPVRNIAVRLEGAAASPSAQQGLVVIGAHYDSAVETPAANDNGSGVAVLLELARAMREQRAASGFAGVRLVFFVNEEPPHFKTTMMGS